MMVMRSLIFGNAQPVHRSRSNGRIRVFVQDLLKQPFRIWPLLFHDGHARQSHQELRREIIFRKVPFNAIALFAVFIKDDHGGRPHGLKPTESGGIFLDVNSDGNEILFNKRCEL